MNILVTGGCGFIGSNLCRKLVEQNHNVFCVDNLMTGSITNINDIIDLPNFKYAYYDVKSEYTFEFVPDQIYHLACPASPIHYQNNSLDTILTCIKGAINMLELANKYKCRILLTSTSEVYGDPDVSPQNENYWGNVNPVGLRSCYDEGKRVSETLFVEYNRCLNVDIRIARIFNTYGPYLHENDGRVIGNFIIQALNDKPITIYGNGSQTRSFCYIDDQLNGLVLLMNSDNYVGPINIGNPNEITVRELANIIIKLTNSKSDIVFLDLPSDDPKKRNPDITKAIKYLNWKPKVNLNDGLIKTIEYFKSH